MEHQNGIFEPSIIPSLSGSSDSMVWKTTYYPPKQILDNILDEEEQKVDVFVKKSHKECIVGCSNLEYLSSDKILKTLSAIKGRLMLEISPIHIRDITCSMTPEVKKNIIQASKKLRAYGKKRPLIACFDEYRK
ncbi:MAG: hypothetical protein K2P14_03575 [Anaeroplasmataceae bacterium]|nr:hypothetical protein [Anaeroplasmataceae bacterium]